LSHFVKKKSAGINNFTLTHLLWVLLILGHGVCFAEANDRIFMTSAKATDVVLHTHKVIVLTCCLVSVFCSSGPAVNGTSQSTLLGEELVCKYQMFCSGA